MGLSDLEKDFGAAAMAKDFPEPPRGEGDKAKKPATAESIQSGIFGAGQPEKLDTVQKIGNAVLPPLVSLPAETAITGGGGALAKHLLPKVPGIAAGGRALTAGVIGGVESGSVKRGAADAGIAATFEGILGAVPYVKGVSSLRRLAEGVTGKREQFERATKAANDAFDAIMPRLPQQRWMFVPALEPNRPISPSEAKAAFSRAEGAVYEAARKQIHAELLKADKWAARNIGQDIYTSKDFGARTLKERFTPPISSKERTAENVIGGLASPGTRAAVDVGATQDAGGMPAGMFPIMKGVEAASSLKDVARGLLR